jgi:hypothetical protein
MRNKLTGVNKRSPGEEKQCFSAGPFFGEVNCVICSLQIYVFILNP